MFKKLIEVFRPTKISYYRFRIKTEKKKSGETIYIPQIKEPGFTTWQQIVKIYNEYIILDFPGQHGLSFEDCMKHLEGYKEQLENKYPNQVIEVQTVEIDLRNKENYGLAIAN
jgi:ribosome biogenesis GTPase A